MWSMIYLTMIVSVWLSVLNSLGPQAFLFLLFVLLQRQIALHNCSVSLNCLQRCMGLCTSVYCMCLCDWVLNMYNIMHRHRKILKVGGLNIIVACALHVKIFDHAHFARSRLMLQCPPGSYAYDYNYMTSCKRGREKQREAEKIHNLLALFTYVWILKVINVFVIVSNRAVFIISFVESSTSIKYISSHICKHVQSRIYRS